MAPATRNEKCVVLCSVSSCLVYAMCQLIVFVVPGSTSKVLSVNHTASASTGLGAAELW